MGPDPPREGAVLWGHDWRSIYSNSPGAAAMQPVPKLLWSFLFTSLSSYFCCFDVNCAMKLKCGMWHQISEDFKILYPQSAENMSAVWPNIYKKVLNQLRSKHVKDKVVQRLLGDIACDLENPRSTGMFCMSPGGRGKDG